MDNFKPVTRTTTQQHHTRLLNQMDEYIITHIDSPFGITQLAEELCISHQQLAHIFQLNRNRSLGNYITARRLEHAATLYYYTGMTLSEVADHTAFASKYSLSKAFTSHFACTPREHQKRTLYRENSPNILLDGITSQDEYHALRSCDIHFQYKENVFENMYLAGLTYPLIRDGEMDELSNTRYLHSLRMPNEPFNHGILFLKAFDSINFGDTRHFRMYHGVICCDEPEPSIRSRYPEAIVVPVPPGRYISFEIPVRSVEDIGYQITLFRENLVGYKKLFRLSDYFDFYSFSIGSEKAFYHLYRGG